MNVLVIALAIVMPLGIAALTTWINIKIKFAPDATQATREAKSIFTKVAFWAVNVYSVCVIIFFFASSWPVDRVFILSVMVNCFYLLTMYVISLNKHLMTAIRGLIETDRLLGEMDKVIMRHVGLEK